LQDILTPKEVQATLRCSLAFVYKLYERGHLPAVVFPNMGEGREKPRSMIRFMRADVIKFIENHYAST
jgi:predicted DNA-binding transcriptional regulator AlpA